MRVKNNPFNLKQVDWTKKMTSTELAAANKAIQILNRYKSIVPKFERASLEKMNVLDEPKDPYMGLHSAEDDIEVDTDGQLSYQETSISGSYVMKPFTISDYNYIIIKHSWPDRQTKEKKVKYITVIVKTYAMKIYVMNSVNQVY